MYNRKNAADETAVEITCCGACDCASRPCGFVLTPLAAAARHGSSRVQSHSAPDELAEAQ